MASTASKGSKKRKTQTSSSRKSISKIEPQARYHETNMEKYSHFENTYDKYINGEESFAGLKVQEKSAVVHFVIKRIWTDYIEKKCEKCKKDKKAKKAKKVIFCTHFEEIFNHNFTWSHVKETVVIFGQEKQGDNGHNREEWRLYCSPRNTLIMELYLVVKPSLIKNAGVGLFTVLPLCEDQTIGIITGIPNEQKQPRASSVSIDRVSTKFGTFYIPPCE